MGHTPNTDPEVARRIAEDEADLRKAAARGRPKYRSRTAQARPVDPLGEAERLQVAQEAEDAEDAE